MGAHFLFLLSVVSLFSLTRCQLAFPGADGFGRFSRGGRGGRVLFVTTLDDSGPGSFRAAVEAAGPRIVVFRISGTIQLKRTLTVRNSFLTIAGQTAPGDGICVRDATFRLYNVSNVVIRYMRFRLGDVQDLEGDAMEGQHLSDVIIDHCSFSWGTDESASFYATENFTVQWSIWSEGLNNSTHAKGAHGYGAILGGKNATFHHNLMAHFVLRNPMFDHPGLYLNDPLVHQRAVSWINNVVYNWGARAASNGPENMVNFVNNFYKPGPATFFHNSQKIMLAPTAGAYQYGKFFVSGNVLADNVDVSADNWKGVRLENTPATLLFLNSTKLFVPIPSGLINTPDTAERALQLVLDDAGASFVRETHMTLGLSEKLAMELSLLLARGEVEGG